MNRSSLPASLAKLEAESIHILREVAAEFEKPVMLYSIGKDSSAMLHLARKAFYPSRVPFPLLHIDTGWKFREMIVFRNEAARQYNLELVVHTNKEAIAAGVTPFKSGAIYTDLMKTQALLQALKVGKFDAAIGGARRDEEKSRAKERIFSVRGLSQGWNPRAQRPEFWRLYNPRLAGDQTMRVFPLSNWTELDVWRYIEAEAVPVVSLYFARPRPTVVREGNLIVVDDDRFPLRRGETPSLRSVRFRTLGCYPLTGAIESEASTVVDLISELEASGVSERQGRLIDFEATSSIEKKKQEGYF